MYKEPKTYKGFEKWWHEIQMTAKMHLYTFMIVLLIHMLIPLLYLVLFKPHILSTVFQVFIGFHTSLWSKALKVLFQYGFWIFVMATPVWLLYPILLTKFKTKSKQIIEDRHLRGTKLINDDELRKIIMEDIKHERRF